MRNADPTEHIPNPPRSQLKGMVATMKDAKSRIQQLNAQLAQQQAEYGRELHQFFRESPPFPFGSSSIEEDLEQYYNLVAHCLYSGDTNLLVTWGIELVAKMPHNFLASEDYDFYYRAFAKERRLAQEPLEEECYALLMEFFEKLRNP